ncbi:MAG: lytic transglycosylase domain-containing protein [Armatimonadota bacterium]
MLSRLPAITQRIADIEARLDGMISPAGRTAPESFAGALDAATRSGPVSPRQSAKQRGEFDAIINEAASRHNLSADLIHAIVRAESGYDPNCRSSAGAIGLMQLMPGTAEGLGITDPWDPAQNIDGGARYLREQMDRFGDLTLALAAYNAGPGAVQRHGGIPPYEETQTYVRRVQDYLQERMAGQ